MKEFYLPTFQECMKIVEENDAFMHKVEEVNGFKAHIFNYRLASYEDFMGHKGALEMRGLTFIECVDVSDASCPVDYERFLHLHKFFNYGEQAGFEGIENSEIKTVQTKEDGSMIVPILWQGEIYCKTRGTFLSDQAEVARGLIAENPRLQEYIRWLYSLGHIPIFEFVSPFNQIVLLYQKPELRLLQVRSLDNGSYRNMSDYREGLGGIKAAEDLHSPELDFNFWFKKCEREINVEGWVVQFENGHWVKIKTDWYVALHHLLTENLTRENEIISWVLNETLDDVLAQVPETDMRRDYALNIAKFIRPCVNEWIKEIQTALADVNPKDKDSRKNFAIGNKDKFLFGVMMQCYSEKVNGFYSEEIVFEYLKKFLLKKTKNWGQAKDFLYGLGFKSEWHGQISEE